MQRSDAKEEPELAGTASDNDRLIGLDGLRGLAAYLVVISHISNATGMWGRLLGDGLGQIGVMIFFCLSGFLMGKLYLDGPFSLVAVAKFFQRRAARVLPLYFIVVLLAYAVDANLPDRFRFYPVNSQNVMGHLLFWKGVAVLWTIPAEVQFYISFPFLWLAYAKWGKNSSMLFAAMIICIAFAGYRSFGVLPIVVSVGHYFLAGILAAMIRGALAERPDTPINIAFIVSGLTVLLSSPNLYTAIWGAKSSGLWDSSLLLAAIPTLVLSTSISPLAAALLGNRVGKFFGDISYSVYLLHIPVLIYLGRFTALPHNPALYRLTILVVATGLAYATFLVIERPARQTINAIRLRHRTPVSLAE
jgi:peptidoglycan/LPS O-acetylase OafA/YrhL